VAASVGGLRHVVVDGVTGFLVEGHEPGAYADRLLATLSDQAVAPGLGSAGRRRAAGFGWDESTDGVLDVYAELLPELAEAPVA
jgi:D-inositol-3-phosphate glycosyltransferase